MFTFSVHKVVLLNVSNHCTEIISSTAACAEVAYILEEDHKNILQDINVL